ncbi:Actin-like ARP9-like protein [Cladobotryum mycophilum]|uniref:Actin-like ARP9-like protein n=1 Tax=Cladobotryum mycophilum TaxID=491253 RepID=A0ABR0T274_9HYPO
MTISTTNTPTKRGNPIKQYKTPSKTSTTVTTGDKQNILSSRLKSRTSIKWQDEAGTATDASGIDATPTPHGYGLRPRKDSQSQALPSSRRSRRASIGGLHTSSFVNGSAHTTPTKTGGSFHFDDRRGFFRINSSSMASATGKWREEQILIICPGSRTTMAQLGDGDDWRPYHTFKRTKIVDGVEQEEWVEDVDEDKGAVWPIEGGRIVQMEPFLAFLDHVHGMLTTTYHNTPIMLMASPQWTRPDCETIARYIFEKTKTPALCMIHSGLATQYGLKWPNMTVIDIGYEKVDVTAIHDGRVVNHLDLGSPQPGRHISGGEVFTRKLQKLLESKGFSRDMAEQLKKSTICEVLPYAPTEKNLVELPVETAAPPGQATVVVASAPVVAQDIPKINEPPKLVDNGLDEPDIPVDEDGVLDVATIVTTGQTKEFLAKKEKEKEKGKPGRKPKDKEAEQAKPVRLPNSKKVRNTFFYEEVIQEEVPRAPKENGAVAAPAVPVEATDKPANEAGGESKTDGAAPPAADGAAPVPAAEESKPAEPSVNAPQTEIKTEAPASNEPPEFRPKRIRRDIEVGLERFTFADREEIDRIVSTIYRAVQGIEDMYMRPACWENLVFVGNGARLRGLKDNILQTLQARHLISPSTATMFTSELPSNVATPAGTGSQTPTGSFTGAPHQLPSSGVNPLLQAATTASTLGAAAAAAAATATPAATSAAVQAATPQPGSEAAGPASSHHFHSQTPTTIKTANLPTYLSEWTKNGFEESMFLGAQVAARIAFCLHSNIDAQGVEAQRMMSLSRVDYNELGPKAIRTHSMLS